MSSVHSHLRQALESSSFLVTLTTRSRSGNSKRCGVSESRSFGPMSGSVLISSNVRSMTTRNSFADLNPIPAPTLHEGRSSLHEVVVEHVLDRVADAFGQLEDERAVLGSVRSVARQVDRLAELDAPLGRERHRAQRAEEREGGREREVRRAGEAREQPRLADLRVDL